MIAEKQQNRAYIEWYSHLQPTKSGINGDSSALCPSLEVKKFAVYQ